MRRGFAAANKRRCFGASERHLEEVDGVARCTHKASNTPPTHPPKYTALGSIRINHILFLRTAGGSTKIFQSTTVHAGINVVGLEDATRAFTIFTHFSYVTIKHIFLRVSVRGSLSSVSYSTCSIHGIRSSQRQCVQAHQ